MQTQCWICPHCFDDSYHKSNRHGCEWQEKPSVAYRIEVATKEQLHKWTNVLNKESTLYDKVISEYAWRMFGGCK